MPHQKRKADDMMRYIANPAQGRKVMPRVGSYLEILDLRLFYKYYNLAGCQQYISLSRHALLVAQHAEQKNSTKSLFPHSICHSHLSTISN
jgi:hypothetical protein